MSTSKTWPGGATNTTPTAFSIPAAGELNWASLSDFLNALGDSAQGTSFQKWAVRKATTTPVTVSATADCVVVTDLAAPGAVTVNLPAGATKQVFVIVDGKGDAGTNNITINRSGSDTIAGGTTLVLASNRETVVLVYNVADTDWKIATRSRTIADLTQVTGVLPIANGGTNSSTALSNNRIVTSQVGALKEAAAITAGRLLKSDTNGIPTAAGSDVDSSDRYAIRSTSHTYKLTNGGGDVTSEFLVDATGSVVSNASALSFDTSNSLVFLRGNTGNVRIARAVVLENSLSNTAGAERSELLLSTKPASGAYQTNLTIGDSGIVTVGPTAAVQASFTGNLIRGVNDGNSGSTGYVGEYLERLVTSGSPTTLISGYTAVDSTGITLSAGDWDITALGSLSNGTGTGTVVFQVGISTSTGNNNTGFVDGINMAQMPITNAQLANADATLTVPVWRVSTSGTPTYYLKIRTNFTTGSMIGYGRISARRVR